MRDSELDDVRVCLEEELLAVEAAEKEPPSYAPERQRFYILAVLSLFSFCQCLNWFTFSSVDPQKVEDYYGAAVGGQAAIDMLLNWGPVAGIAFFPVQLWLLERRDGLRKNVVAGALLVLAGASVRLVPTLLLGPAARRRWASGLWLHAGQLLNAAAGPFCMGPVSRVAVVWFPEVRESRPAGAFLSPLSPERARALTVARPSGRPRDRASARARPRAPRPRTRSA